MRGGATTPTLEAGAGAKNLRLFQRAAKAVQKAMEETRWCRQFARACGRGAEFIEGLLRAGERGLPNDVVEELRNLQRFFSGQ